MALAASLLVSNAWADQTFIVCKLTKTVDEKGAASAITGTDVVVIDTQPDGSSTYTVQAGCRENTLTAKVSDTELMFECKHAAVETNSYLMTINRVSGEYVKIFTTSASSGLVHYGHCAPSNRQFDIRWIASPLTSPPRPGHQRRVAMPHSPARSSSPMRSMSAAVSRSRLLTRSSVSE